MSNRDGMSNSGHSVSLGLQFRLDIPSRLGVPSRWTFRLAGQLTVWKFRLVGHSVSMDIQTLNRHTLPQKTFCSRGVRIRIARYRVHAATTAKQQMHAVRVRPQRSPCLRLLCSLVIQRIYTRPQSVTMPTISLKVDRSFSPQLELLMRVLS